jgi:hypothetical protein
MYVVNTPETARNRMSMVKIQESIYCLEGLASDHYHMASILFWFRSRSFSWCTITYLCFTLARWLLWCLLPFLTVSFILILQLLAILGSSSFLDRYIVKHVKQDLILLGPIFLTVRFCICVVATTKTINHHR